MTPRAGDVVHIDGCFETEYVVYSVAGNGRAVAYEQFERLDYPQIRDFVVTMTSMLRPLGTVVMRPAWDVSPGR